MAKGWNGSAKFTDTVKRSVEINCAEKMRKRINCEYNRLPWYSRAAFRTPLTLDNYVYSFETDVDEDGANSLRVYVRNKFAINVVASKLPAGSTQPDHADRCGSAK
ncbi:uncharacterized protein LOC143212991 [Lasioglossum baleicum]|uniref:uncharacterized protein LOC143212991 n=1 Tax=Lasioglossum baleicum TaxID=434251 RepID=UPI003FCDAF19